MKKRRKAGAARKGSGNGSRAIAFVAAREAFHDAMYAILLEDFEKTMRDPARRAKYDRILRQLAHALLEDLGP